MPYHRELDGLRALAVSMVLIAHLPLIQGFAPWDWIKFLGAALRFGYLGVDVFFVLSGFLITRILYEQRGFSLGLVLKSFLAKRALRILPIYYLCVFYCVLIIGISPEEAWANVLFLSNYFYAFNDHASPLRHTWSLAVEEQFYLIWPFIILLSPRMSLSWVIILFSLSAAILTALALPFFLDLQIYDMLLVRATSFRLLSLSAGALLAVHYQNLFRIDRKIFLVLALFLIPLLQLIIRYAQIPHAQLLLAPVFTVWSVSIFLTVLLYGSDTRSGWNPIASLFRHRIAVYVGQFSYGLYLYHLIVLHQLNLRDSYRPEGVTGSEFLIGVVLMFGVSMLSYHYFEKPIQCLKKHFILEPPLHSKIGSFKAGGEKK